MQSKTLFFCAGAVCAADCTCCVLMSGTGFVAPADLPLSDDEDEQATDAFLSMSIQGSGSDDLFVQVQSAPAQASSQRHVGFGQETEGYSMLFMGVSS